MKWEKFAHKFDKSWHHKMQPFIESEECDKIFKFLKERAKTAEIAPESNNTFRCFYETPYDQLNAVILGYCPYHSKHDGKIVADGLAMSCSITKKMQPSLEIFYEAVERDAYDGLNLDGFKEENLEFLARQGVLLFNAALTTEIGNAGAHQEIWEPFTRYIIGEAIIETGVPVIALGKEAQKFSYLFPSDYPLFEITHPAYAAYRKEPWDTKGAFKAVRELVLKNNGINIEFMDPVPF